MTNQTKILIIEDDKLQAKVTGDLLTSKNYDVCIAYNGAEGIQKTFEYSPDLVLCDINMAAIDGYHVYNVLKESSVLDEVPFIFITGNSNLAEIRYGMVIGADDYFIKPFNIEDLLNTIEKLLKKFKKIKEIGRREFSALFEASPNGVFLFDGEVIFDANPAMLKMVGIEREHITSYTIQDIIEPLSYQEIQEKIHKCSNGVINSFSERVELRSKSNTNLVVSLVISVYQKYAGHSLMAGLCTQLHQPENEDEYFYSNVLRVLKKENIAVTESLVSQLNQVFNKQESYSGKIKSSFLSKRESEVLSLSMEGLPMKIIADKLSISDRTVEKHRANLMEKTNSKNMIEVIIYALRNNLIEI